MSSYKRCDKCGESDEQADFRTIRSVTVTFPSDYDCDKCGDPEFYDLCGTCRRLLQEFLKPNPKEGAPS